MTPAATQMMTFPIGETPLFREGSMPAGAPVKSPDGFAAVGKDRASRPAGSGEGSFSRILAEQTAEPKQAAEGEEKAAITGPACAEPIVHETEENTGKASDGEKTESVPTDALALLQAQPVLPPVPLPTGQAEEVEAGIGSTGAVPVADSSNASGPDATGKIFPAPPVAEGMPAPVETAGPATVTDDPAAAAAVDQRLLDTRSGPAGKKAVETMESAAATKTEKNSDAAVMTARFDDGSALRPAEENAPAAGSGKAEKPATPNPSAARANGPVEGEEATEMFRAAVVEKGMAPADSEAVAGTEQTNRPARNAAKTNEGQPAGSPSRVAGDALENAESDSAAAPAGRRTSGPDGSQAAANSGVVKDGIRTKGISSSGPFEVRRTDADSAQAAAKGQKNRLVDASQAKQAVPDSPSPVFRETAEQVSPSGVEKAVTGNSGEAQGALAAAKPPSSSAGAFSEALRDPSAAVPRQAHEAWAAAAEKHGTDGGRVRIVLSPDHLGTLDMDVRVRREAVEIMMSVQREESLHTLRGHASDLKAALSDQGLRVESLSLQTSGRDLQSNGGPSGGYGGLYDGRNMNESGGRDAGSGRRNGESGAAAPQAAGTAPRKIATDGISIFA